MALTVDLAAMDKECSALGGLFQQVITDMKVSRLDLAGEGGCTRISASTG